jgi:hypothetical protein
MLERHQATASNVQPWRGASNVQPFIQHMAGAANEKRKAPSQALRVAQLQSTHVPLKRTQSDALSSVEVSKLEAALSNDASCGWTLASNLKIV